MPSSFGSRLQQAFDRYGQLCVGIDPHEQTLGQWGLEDSARGVDYFANTMLDACATRVGIIKPQVSFFERHGSKGFAVLETITHRAKEAGLLVIADAKRGDIGTTMQAYLDAWVGKGSSFYADTVTVSPFLGLKSSTNLLAGVLERGKGLTVLVATSNPEGESVQLNRNTENETLSQQLWTQLHEINQVTAAAGDQFGALSAVVGATLDFNRFGLDLELPGVKTAILAPGFGAQGARLNDIERLFGGAKHQVIASVSRSISEAGASGLVSEISRASDSLAAGLS